MHALRSGAIALACAAEVVVIFAAFRSLASGGVLQAIALRVRSSASRVATAARRLGAAAGEDGGAPDEAREQEASRRKAAELLEAWAVARARRAIAAVAAALAVGFPALLLDAAAETATLTSTAIVALSLASAASAATIIRPELVVGRNLVWWHALCALTLCVLQSPLGCSTDVGLVIFRTPLLLGSVVAGSICVDIRVLVVSFTCLSACVAWSYASSPGNFGDIQLVDIVTSEVVTVLCRLLAFRSFQSSLDATAAQTIRADTTHCYSAAASSLLEMVCDAVVETNQDLRVKKHAASLGCILMLDNGESLAGSSLTNFIDDSCGLRNQVQAVRDQQPDNLSTDVLHGHLRDRLGNLISVVMYRVPYLSILGEVHHLIGFREASEEGSPSGLRATLPEAELSEDVARCLAECSWQPLRHRSGASHGSVPGERTRTVDVAAVDRLPIFSATDGFRRSFGAASGSFAALLRGGGAGLRAWIRRRVELVQAGLLPAPCVETYGEVSVAGEEALRLVTVCFPAPPADCGDADYRVSINLGRARRVRRSAVRGPTPEPDPDNIALEV